MPNMRHHFNALLSKINPTDERRELAARRVGEVRDWLAQHDFKTKSPHTRLSGSYSRSTAIENIPDVDVLLFLPDSELDRTPNAVILGLQGVLKDYPGANIDTRCQRRSVRLSLGADDLELDIVPSVPRDGLERPLRVPDRPRAVWIESDPLSYAERLSKVNLENGGKLVPLIKLLKAWRDEQMLRRKPKSYVLEVILLYAVEDGELVLCDSSTATNVRDAFVYITDKYEKLMDEGTGSPRVPDPQVQGSYITRGWERAHFETFLRRAREARRAAERALNAQDEEKASAEWARVFGSRWPSPELVKEAARAEGKANQPGQTAIDSLGRVLLATAAVGLAAAAVAKATPTRPTRFHGTDR